MFNLKYAARSLSLLLSLLHSLSLLRGALYAAANCKLLQQIAEQLKFLFN